MFADAIDLPSGITGFLQQGGAFALLSIMVILGVPWMIKNWKESINTTISSFAQQWQNQQQASERMCQNQQTASERMTAQVTSSMEKIAEAMEAMKDEFGERLRTVESHLEINDRVAIHGKRGI